jgi:hypothetical protein
MDEEANMNSAPAPRVRHYLDFHLAIGRPAGQDYPDTALASPAGDAICATRN